jgi:hypothetical protein
LSAAKKVKAVEADDDGGREQVPRDYENRAWRRWMARLFSRLLKQMLFSPSNVSESLKLYGAATSNKNLQAILAISSITPLPFVGDDAPVRLCSFQTQNKHGWTR